MKLIRLLLALALFLPCARAGSPALAPADYRVVYVRPYLGSQGQFFVVPAGQVNRNAAQLANKIFDSTNSALRINAVATGGGGGPAADNPNLDQIFNRAYDSTNN